MGEDLTIGVVVTKRFGATEPRSTEKQGETWHDTVRFADEAAHKEFVDNIFTLCASE